MAKGTFSPAISSGRGYAFARLTEGKYLDIRALEEEVALNFRREIEFGIRRVKKALTLSKKAGYRVLFKKVNTFNKEGIRELRIYAKIILPSPPPEESSPE